MVRHSPISTSGIAMTDTCYDVGAAKAAKSSLLSMLLSASRLAEKRVDHFECSSTDEELSDLSFVPESAPALYTSCCSTASSSSCSIPSRKRQVRFAVDEHDCIQANIIAFEKNPIELHPDLHWSKKEIARKVQSAYRLSQQYAAEDRSIAVQSALHLYDLTEAAALAASATQQAGEETEHNCSDHQHYNEDATGTNSETDEGDYDDNDNKSIMIMTDELAIRTLCKGKSRGLERFFSPVIREHRLWVNQNVLQFQDKLRNKGKKNISNALCKRSMKLSGRCLNFALKIAEGDAREARAIHEEPC